MLVKPCVRLLMDDSLLLCYRSRCQGPAPTPSVGLTGQRLSSPSRTQLSSDRALDYIIYVINVTCDIYIYVLGLIEIKYCFVFVRLDVIKIFVKV